MIYVLRHCKANGQDINAQLTPEGQLAAKRLMLVLNFIWTYILVKWTKLIKRLNHL